MAKNQNRRPGRSRQAKQQGAGKRARKQFLNTPSLIFVGILVLMTAVAVAVTLIGGADNPRCPPGLVWSDDHGHCH